MIVESEMKMKNKWCLIFFYLLDERDAIRYLYSNYNLSFYSNFDYCSCSYTTSIFKFNSLKYRHIFFFALSSDFLINELYNINSKLEIKIAIEMNSSEYT